MNRGRPLKLGKEDKIQAYIYHIAGYSAWEIAKEFNCSDRTIHKALDWVRGEIPQYDERQNLLDITQATMELIKDLNIRKRQIVGDVGEEFETTESVLGEGKKATTTHKKVHINWNAYIGVMRELRENYLLLHKLHAVQKTSEGIRDDTMGSIWEVINANQSS